MSEVDSPDTEYSTFRNELLAIIQHRYLLFTSLVAVYGLSFSLITSTAPSFLQKVPLLLLMITLPVLIMNYYLSRHFHRVDTYIRVIEESFPSTFRWQQAYSGFRKLQKSSTKRWIPKSLVASAYTVPLLLGYVFLISFGALSSYLLNSHSICFIVYFIVPCFGVLLFSFLNLEGFWRWKGLRGKFFAWWKMSFEWSQVTEKVKPEVVVFLDRDGVLNKNQKLGVLSLDKFRPVKDFDRALRLLARPHFRLAVVTNQPYVGEGKLTIAELTDIHSELERRFYTSLGNVLPKEAVLSIRNDYLYIEACTHLESDNCKCRKPNIGLFQQAIKKFENANPAQFSSNSFCPTIIFVVGDQISDFKAAENLREQFPKSIVKMVLVISRAGLGKNARELLLKQEKKQPDKVANSLFEAAVWINEQSPARRYMS